jgi:hypothetical protein
MPWEHAELHEVTPQQPEGGDSPQQLPDSWQRAEGRLPTAVAVLLWAVVVVALVALVAGVVRAGPRAWRDRRWARWRRPDAVAGFVEPPAAERAAAAVVADAAEQRALLARGSPRDAIVACWLRLEATVASAGVDHLVSDTSTELTERVLASATVDRAALGALAALYREARFSRHPMGEAQREAAVAALDAVHAGLRAAVPA